MWMSWWYVVFKAFLFFFSLSLSLSLFLSRVLFSTSYVGVSLLSSVFSRSLHRFLKNFLQSRDKL